MPHLLKIKVLAVRRSALDILTTIYLVRRGDLLNFNIFNINPFAPGDFAEKRVLKLVEWFSGHCRAIKS